MKLTKIYPYLWILMGMFFLYSCSSDDDFSNDSTEEPTEEISYQNGFFVLNEGQFPNEGTVTFISEDFQTVEHKIFQQNNNGLELGNTPQSMFFDGDKVYIITNSSNFIRVADRYTFKDLGIISGEMSNPRYGVAYQGKAYVSNGYASHLTVLDLENQSVEKTISMENAAEFIEEKNGLIYIQQASFGSGNKIAVLDPVQDEIIQYFETANALNSFVLDDDFLYALSAIKLQKFALSDAELMTEISLENLSAVANLTLEDEKLYFTSGKKVFEVHSQEMTISEEPVFEIESDSYGLFYGFTVKNSHFYVADGGDFVSDSYIDIRDLQGNLVRTITVGVGPNGFYFNE